MFSVFVMQIVAIVHSIHVVVVVGGTGSALDSFLSSAIDLCEPTLENLCPDIFLFWRIPPPAPEISSLCLHIFYTEEFLETHLCLCENWNTVMHRVTCSTGKFILSFSFFLLYGKASLSV